MDKWMGFIGAFAGALVATVAWEFWDMNAVIIGWLS